MDEIFFSPDNPSSRIRGAHGSLGNGQFSPCTKMSCLPTAPHTQKTELQQRWHQGSTWAQEWHQPTLHSSLSERAKVFPCSHHCCQLGAFRRPSRNLVSSCVMGACFLENQNRRFGNQDTVCCRPTSRTLPRIPWRKPLLVLHQRKGMGGGVDVI